MAWVKAPQIQAQSSRAKTLSEIMREEEDAKLAQRFAPPLVEDFDEQLRLALELSRISEEEEAKKRQLMEDEALAQSLAQASAIDSHREVPSNEKTSVTKSDSEMGITDEEYALILESSAMDEDAMLAKFLQIEERRNAGHLQFHSLYKELTPLEQKLFNLEFGTEESEDEFADDIDLEEELNILNNRSKERTRGGSRGADDEEEEEEEPASEYNYTEPYSLLDGADVDPTLHPQMPRLYDGAQRREDAELAHVTRREKVYRPNATFVALHHQNFETRNVGKRQAEIFKPYDGSNKGRKQRRDAKGRRQYLLSLPYLYPDFYAFGYVEEVRGASQFSIYSYEDGGYYRAVLTKLLKRSSAFWIDKGDIVVLKMRGNRMVKVDILLKLTSEEYFFLPRLGCMAEHDPAKLLPVEVMSMILSHLPFSDREVCGEVSAQWKAAIPPPQGLSVVTASSVEKPL